MASSGQIYFSLKDENAVLNAICWRNVAMKFPLQIEDGMEVICVGGISTYPGRSNYQITVKSIRLAGEGMLLAMLEERRKKLMQEGLFDEVHKKAIPKIPQKIGIITSLQGAVIKDILHRIQDRFPTQVLIWDVPVQGNEAAGYVAAAIVGFNELPAHITPPDVIIVARGGGSIEDLWAFNEEIVLRAVFNSKIPIISAIGHETDNTLIDLVADLRAPTPTAAAEFVTPDRAQINHTLLKSKLELNRALPAFINSKQISLERLSMRLHKNLNLFQEQKIKLQNLKVALRLNFNDVYQSKLSKFNSLNLSPLNLNRLIQNSEEKLLNNLWKIRNLYQNKINAITNQLHASKKLLISYSHKNVLQRGFAIVRDGKNHLIASAHDIAQNKIIQMEFHDGAVTGLLTKSGTSTPSKTKSPNKIEQSKLPF
jgi:exodeoxyribonuclease VII large subunit